jgi:hypothetical protein
MLVPRNRGAVPQIGECSLTCGGQCLPVPPPEGQAAPPGTLGKRQCKFTKDFPLFPIFRRLCRTRLSLATPDPDAVVTSNISKHYFEHPCPGCGVLSRATCEIKAPDGKELVQIALEFNPTVQPVANFHPLFELDGVIYATRTLVVLHKPRDSIPHVTWWVISPRNGAWQQSDGTPSAPPATGFVIMLRATRFAVFPNNTAAGGAASLPCLADADGRFPAAERPLVGRVPDISVAP